MHKTQPRMASLDSWELIRSQTWRSTVPRWPAAAVRLLRRSCTAEAANLLLKRRTTRERSKRKTAGMLPERERESESEREREREREREEGKLSWMRDEVTGPEFLSEHVQSAGRGRGACKVWLSKLPLWVRTEELSDKSGTAETAGDPWVTLWVRLRQCNNAKQKRLPFKRSVNI